MSMSVASRFVFIEDYDTGKGGVQAQAVWHALVPYS